MGYVIWALDPESGEAILKEGKHWYLAAMDRNWRPLELEEPGEILRWSLSRYVIPVNREYATRDESIIAARHVCQSIRSGVPPSSDEVQRLLSEHERVRNQRRRLDPPGWERRFPEIVQAGLELDSYFRAQGCSVEESLQFILRVIQRLRESAGWAKSGHELRLALLELARAVYRKPEEQPEEVLGAFRLSDIERRRITKIVGRLPFEVLNALTLWADSAFGVDEIGILLNASPAEVRRRIELAAQELGRPAEHLRGPTLVGLCRETMQSRP